MNEIRRPATTFAPASATVGRAEAENAAVVWDGMLGFLKRRRRSITVTTLGVVLVGLVGTLFIPWSYKATVVVALNAYPAIPENPNLHQPIPQAERVQREIQGLQSRAVAARVIEKLKLDQGAEFDPDTGSILGAIARFFAGFGQTFGAGAPPSSTELQDLRRSAIVDIFMGKLTVTPILTAEQIQVTFSSRDPRTAYSAANAVVDTYIESAMALRAGILQKAADALQERISAVREELRGQAVGPEGANTLERQLEAKRTLLQAYIAKLGELLLMKAAVEPRVFVQSRAVYPMQRAGVPLVFAIPFLVVAGLLGGIGVSMYQEGRRNTIASAAELEALFGLRSIGVAQSEPAAANPALGPDPKRLARACDRIAMELLMAREGERSTVVAIAAPTPSAAKSAICVGVAEALARAGHRTLLIDANLARSAAQARLGARAASPPAGTAPAPAGETAFALRRDPASGLDVLPTGLDRESRAADYDRAAGAVASLAPGYAFTLLDLPPVGADPAARYLARHADLAILVTRRDHDRRGAVRASVDQLQGSGARIVGAVLTRGTFEQGMFARAAERLGLGV